MPLPSHGLRNSRTARRETPFSGQCTSSPSRVGRINGDMCHGLQGDTGTSETNYLRIMDCSRKDRGWSYQGSYKRNISNVYMKAISLQTRYKRMLDNICIGLESMRTLKTTLRDARNVSSGLRLPMSPSSLMTYQRVPGGSLAWITLNLMAIHMS